MRGIQDGRVHRKRCQSSGSEAWLKPADAIRAYAGVMVVTIHVAAYLVTRLGSMPASWWWVANLADAFARPAVPLFFMLSGMLLLDPAKREPVRVFLWKRARRVGLPLIFWSVVYMLWRVFFHGQTITWKSGVARLIDGRTYSGFAFMYVLLGLYLATPVLRVYVRHASRKNLLYLIAVWFVLVPLSALFSRFSGIEVAVQSVVALDYVGYYLLGHLFRDVKLGRRATWTAAGGVVLLTGIVASGTALLSTPESLDTTLYSYLGPAVVLMSILVFLILKSLPFGTAYARFPVAERAVGFVGSAALTIYFLNYLLLECLMAGCLGFALSGWFVHPLLGIPLTVLAVVGIAAVAHAFLSRLPALRWLVGEAPR
ncbi:MAG: acyltransferase family protein [Candidatus Bipolaricaulota bacterium]